MRGCFLRRRRRREGKSQGCTERQRGNMYAVRKGWHTQRICDEDIGESERVTGSFSSDSWNRWALLCRRCLAKMDRTRQFSQSVCGRGQKQLQGETVREWSPRRPH
jgi:hypothetical protein